MNFAALWASSKAIIVLGAALAASGALNVWQWRADIIEDTKAREAVKLAAERARSQKAEDALSVVSGMVEQKLTDDAELARLRAQNAELARRRDTTYTTRVQQAGPVPVCRANDAQAAGVNEAIR